MADPRLRVSSEGIGAERITLKIDDSTITYSATEEGGSASVNLAVTLSADETAALTADGDAVYGKLMEVYHDGYCSVQRGGVASLPAGAAATVTRGTKIVGALGAASAKGYIRSAASGTAAELIKCRGMIIANGTTTAVLVDLDA